LTSTPVVVADTSPINYLILTGDVAVLPVLFGRIILPTVVRDELARTKAPLTVREWLANPPAWLDVRPSSQTGDASMADLDDGERSAILLAIELHADLLLIDERRAAKTARSKGFRVAGTLAILGMAARRDLLSLSDAIDRLKRTSFHYRQEILDQFLADQGGKA
jgi:predicted nucleic acid-binding protein